MHYTYNPTGVCSRRIEFDIIGDVITNISFLGGCNGNLQGLSSLLKGMDIDEAIARLKGIKCGPRATSCPDQISKALESIKR